METFTVLKVKKTDKDGKPIWWAMLRDQAGAELKARTFSSTLGEAMQMNVGRTASLSLVSVTGHDFFAIEKGEVIA